MVVRVVIFTLGSYAASFVGCRFFTADCHASTDQLPVSSTSPHALQHQSTFTHAPHSCGSLSMSSPTWPSRSHVSNFLNTNPLHREKFPFQPIRRGADALGVHDMPDAPLVVDKVGDILAHILLGPVGPHAPDPKGFLSAQVGDLAVLLTGLQAEPIGELTFTVKALPLVLHDLVAVLGRHAECFPPQVRERHALPASGRHQRRPIRVGCRTLAAVV